MFPLTYRNRVLLMVANFTKATLFSGLFLFGLLPISVRNGRIVNTLLVTSYSVSVGLLFTAMFVYSLVTIVSDRSITSFYGTESMVTFALQGSFSVLIIGSFYSIAILNRFRLAAFYNRLKGDYASYQSFYKASFAIRTLSPENVDGEEELRCVYVRLFFKVIVVPLLASLCNLGVASLNHRKRNTPLLEYGSYLLMPYLVQTLTSSFMFFSAVRTSFLYRRMEEKLRSLGRELTHLSQKSPFERMTRCCEISDLVDDLARCYGSINDTMNDLIGLHRFQIVVTLVFLVINILHRMFLQYMVAGQAVKGTVPFDFPMLIVTVSNITLGIVELLLIVDVTDSCHSGSVRVGKTVQEMVYFRDLDIRLKQSVRGMHSM